ncbi:hypothetical protein [Chitinophaga varians]|uniref:hypothetical protein n=1 Tax=Chitinophaga varians TaxID=2202339 RepID=UPI00165FC105|nr:hypothetical protein [Chitinophaga varians]MBC9909632.1 hypothetical protein [Chitinophaga varians]
MMNAEAFRCLVEAQDQRPLSEKIRLIEKLLFQFTIAARVIGSDDRLSDKQIVIALKWLNEMTHRTWNILYDLRRNEDHDSMGRLYACMRQYAAESRELGGHLAESFRLAMSHF